MSDNSNNNTPGESNNNSNNNNNNNNPKPTINLDLTEPDAAELLQVKVIPSCEYALKGVQNTIHVLFQIKTGRKSQNQTRPPCDLALVLDRSGSMQGEKLENSKLAIKEVIKNLTQDDILHLITYESDVQVVFEKGDLSNREALYAQVNDIKEDGMTNLYAGLEKACEILKTHKIEGASRIQRVFLFSDGLVNKGKTSPAEIKQLVQSNRAHGISVSSFGIGSDFDEELMKNIAEWGSGDYFFIENAEVIPKFVEKGLAGLLMLIGTDPVLKVRGDNGAIVKKIFAHDAVAGAHLGDLKQDNLRQIVSVVEVSPTQGEGANLINWSLTYIPDNRNTRAELKGSLYIKYTDDDELLQKKNPAVEIAKSLQEMGETDLDVVDLIDKGKRDEALKRKQADLDKLKALLPLDTTGTIELMIQKTEKQVTNLADKAAKQEDVRKEAHYHGYLNRKNSFYAFS